MVEKKDKKPKTEEPVDTGEATPEVDALQKQARERDEFLDLLQRTRAEFSNYRKRIERERVEWGERSVGEFALRLLPVLDDFDRALAHADESPDFESFVRGIRLIESKIYGVLQSSGVEPFEPTGERFSPAEHEAITVETTDEKPDGTVSEVLLKGYRQSQRILRAAQVKVVRNPPAEVPAEDTDVPDESGEEEETTDADV